MAEPQLRRVDEDRARGLSVCVSDKLSGDADAAGPATAPWKPQT